MIHCFSLLYIGLSHFQTRRQQIHCTYTYKCKHNHNNNNNNNNNNKFKNNSNNNNNSKCLYKCLIFGCLLLKTKTQLNCLFSKQKMVTSRYCWTQGANHGGSWVSRKGIGKQPPLGRAMGIVERGMLVVNLPHCCRWFTGKVYIKGLLGGGFNPFEKYARQNGNLPQIGMKKKKRFETTT